MLLFSQWTRRYWKAQLLDFTCYASLKVKRKEICFASRVGIQNELINTQTD